MPATRAGARYQPSKSPVRSRHIHGYFTLIGCYLLMMFYTTVAGWMLHYFYMTAAGKLVGLDTDQVPVSSPICWQAR